MWYYFFYIYKKVNFIIEKSQNDEKLIDDEKNVNYQKNSQKNSNMIKDINKDDFKGNY